MSDTSPQTVLEVRGLRQEARPPIAAALAIDALTLRAGELAVILLERDAMRPPLADLAMGLIEPDEGTVFFLGAPWANRTPDDAAQNRFRIGRIFDGPGSSWVSNLDLDENITLPLRYHSGPLSSERMALIATLAEKAGCWPLPETRPVATNKDMLKRMEWVRALATEPMLLLLERPLRDITGDMKPFGELVADARKRGAAILWMTTGEREWHDVGQVATARFAVRRGKLEAAENS